jgi:hypothetical protein
MAAAHSTVLLWNGVGGIKLDGGDRDVFMGWQGGVRIRDDDGIESGFET